MGIITKFKTWIFQAKSSENSEDTRLLQTIVSPAKEQVEPQKELSESEQQLLQIKSFIDSDDLSNHELAAMFMQGLEVQLDESMLRAIKRSADKMIFWLGVDDNANFIKSVKELIIGPPFFCPIFRNCPICGGFAAFDRATSFAMEGQASLESTSYSDCCWKITQAQTTLCRGLPDEFFARKPMCCATIRGLVFVGQ